MVFERLFFPLGWAEGAAGATVHATVGMSLADDEPDRRRRHAAESAQLRWSVGAGHARVRPDPAHVILTRGDQLSSRARRVARSRIAARVSSPRVGGRGPNDSGVDPRRPRPPGRRQAAELNPPSPNRCRPPRVPGDRSAFLLIVRRAGPNWERVDCCRRTEHW
jgi:hypothetical protein